jgi:hypothetical protein
VRAAFGEGARVAPVGGGSPWSLLVTFTQLSPQGSEEMKSHSTPWDSQSVVSRFGCLLSRKMFSVIVHNLKIFLISVLGIELGASPLLDKCSTT